MDNVTFEHGASTFSNPTFVGQSVAEVRQNQLVRSILSLVGGESVRVSTNGASFRTVNDTYRLVAGDTVQFTRDGGTKGC